MTRVQYSSEQLFEIGKANYEKLALHCQTLEVSGFWEQARKVMQQSSTEVLDMYVQSVLMELAVQCGNVLGSQLSFIQAVPISNPLGITDDMEMSQELMRDVDRMYKLPPVLIQLCSLYDKQNSDDMTEYFIDALLNILLCMAYLNGGKDDKVNEFIKTYYSKVSYYVLERTPAEHSSYLLRKLQGNSIECDVEKKVSPAVEWHEMPDTPEKEQCQRETADQTGGRLQEGIAAEEGQADEDAGEMHSEDSAEYEDAEWDEDDTEAEEDEPDWDEDDIEAGEGKPSWDEDDIEAGEGGQAWDETDAKADGSGQAWDSSVAGEMKSESEENASAVMAETQSQKDMPEKTLEEQEAEISAQAKAQFLLVKKRIQDRELAEQRAHEQKIQGLMDELNSMVGLGNVKQEIQSLINLIKIRKLRSQMCLPEMEMSYHMVFTGSPGTGKTTVARLVAKIYKELGILSEGNLVETDRSGLVAGYVGQTAIKVHEIVEKAIGGILFIDEAYSLANPDIQNDFGPEAVDTLVKLMEDHRDNLVIIVAGYTDEMQDFLKSNTGLISRFNKFIDFSDYTREELVEIMQVMATNAGLTIEEDAKKEVLHMMEQKKPEEWKDFGNARGIRNLFEKFIMNQANRLVMLDNPSKEDLITIKREDVYV